MSCPSWSRLVAEREDLLGADPEGWEAALEHLDGCPRCAREAPEVDPLLLFRRLPAPKVAPADIESMKLGVAAMIRASRVQGAAGPTVDARLVSLRRWRLPAAVAATVLAALGLVSLLHFRAGSPATVVAGTAAQMAMSPPAPMSDVASSIEDLSLADARVYEVASEGLSVITIVHPSLDL